MKENKYMTYLMIGIGEIILVVVGILIAIQIDDWNRDRELEREELETYQLIIADLKKDSVLLKNYHEYYSRYLDTYFALNQISKGNGYFAGLSSDHIVSNIQFNAVTQKNHEISIDRLRNKEVRESINSYFQSMNLSVYATEEFNKLIERETRPFFLKDLEVFDNQVVFNEEDRTFPPFLGRSTIDSVKLKATLGHPKAIPLISLLRMSIGFYLASIERSIAGNAQLIQILESKLE